MKKNPIGIIAEDSSDAECIKILIQKISNHNYAYISFLGKGCGKIVRKCKGWADILYDRNCKVLIVVQDSDGNLPKAILDSLDAELRQSKLSNYIISIPVQELEAWLISDPNGIKKAMNLPKVPKFKGSPENIRSPKEELERVIRVNSKNSIMYINTHHNQRIVRSLDIVEINKKCPSFKPFYDFVNTHLT